ncbi:hypothetical protein Gpo141_00005356 [Globisporangium polare]
MAARVTKQFLANVLQNAKKPAALAGGAKGSKAGLLGSLAKSQQQKKKQPAAPQQSKKVRGGKKQSGKETAVPAKKKKANERFLDVAKKEQMHADRTEENLRKLRVRPTDKSQRLMAKALALRTKVLH